MTWSEILYEEEDKYKYALIDFGEATDTILEEKITLTCPSSDEELFEKIMRKTQEFEVVLENIQIEDWHYAFYIIP